MRNLLYNIPAAGAGCNIGGIRMEGTLAGHFVRAVRKNRHRRCISDSTGRKLNYGQCLTAAITLAGRIEKITENQQMAGILLPPSCGAALANLAITLLGKVTVNLNYRLSREVIQSAIEQCGIKTIISSRAFIENARDLAGLPELVFLEDVISQIKLRDKIKAYLKGLFLPAKILTKAAAGGGDGLATVIFSSGSTGKPKGVMLSHRNILSNIESVLKIFRLEPDDNLCGVLPFFHSFGFTCGLWMPLVGGVSASFVANPLDGKKVGMVACLNRSTILFAAPTFLLNYIKRTLPEDFANLRAVIVGSEKLKKSTADLFEQRFGIRTLDAYGATELSPAVSFNLPEDLSTGLYPSGCKAGTVGRPIPGVEVKIVSVEKNLPVAAGQSGLLWVKGPNVMLGYLNDKELTRRVIKDGWYNTGDLARIDEDGFLAIEGRLSRFSKIAGEMVPHIGVEEVYLEQLKTAEQVVAVTALPDAKKGEELVVLHLEKAGGADDLHRIIHRSKLPNIWKPRRGNYIKIKSMPKLGSGKLDIMKLRKIALAAKKSGLVN